MGTSMRCMATLALAGLLLPGARLGAQVDTPAEAQLRDPASARWSAAVSGGVSLGNTTKDIEAAMRAGGWGDIDPGGCLVFCAAPRQYPYSQKNGAGFQLMVTRQWRHPLQLRAALSHANLGTTLGFAQRPTENSGDYLEVQQRVTALGLLASVSAVRDVLWVGAGPALYRLTLTRMDEAKASDERDAVMRVGGIGVIGADVPLSFPVVLQLQAQYRLVGSPEMGPIAAKQAQGSTAPGATEMPRTAVDFNHALFLMGLGLRF